MGMRKKVLAFCNWCGVCSCIAVLGMVLAGCGLVAQVEEVQEDRVPVGALRPLRSDHARWRRLEPPAGTSVDVSSMRVLAMSADGQVIVGEAVRTEDQVSVMDLFSKPFWWHLGRNEWVWLPVGEQGTAPVSVSHDGHIVLGGKWVWEKGAQEVQPLGQRFWGYGIREDGALLGVDLNRQIVMRSIDGRESGVWTVDELFSVDTKGHVLEQMWFAGDGIIYSNIRQCVLNGDCSEAYVMRWSPEHGKEMIATALPQRTESFVQSNPGPQVVSRNGLWLAGSVGQGVYIWDVQGQSRFIGGFEQGAEVLGVSDDGLVAVGEAIDPKTGLERAWIWTATEGLGYLDEWLRDHGVERENLSREMHVQRLSADRRVLIGFTPSYDNVGRVGKPQWWRIDLPEALRVLI